MAAGAITEDSGPRLRLARSCKPPCLREAWSGSRIGDVMMSAPAVTRREALATLAGVALAAVPLVRAASAPTSPLPCSPHPPRLLVASITPSAAGVIGNSARHPRNRGTRPRRGVH